jgi:hypothetical protein
MMNTNGVLFQRDKQGQVEFNDGDFAEVQLYVELDAGMGYEGIAIQIHREDTDLERDEFSRRFAAGCWIKISEHLHITSDYHEKKFCPQRVQR